MAGKFLLPLPDATTSNQDMQQLLCRVEGENSFYCPFMLDSSDSSSDIAHPLQIVAILASPAPVRFGVSHVMLRRRTVQCVGGRIRENV
ncbi:hypothetical protein Zmor_019240 [Zophobas morio]|uniref:Uncharacterized protein n=1 Tax=Zophobas morio TaxID=2755281 RepID=A0AA38I1E2_9CUCU|nr:hypothetical protein Zmor_019240 [Zophobas morio]